MAAHAMLLKARPIWTNEGSENVFVALTDVLLNFENQTPPKTEILGPYEMNMTFKIQIIVIKPIMTKYYLQRTATTNGPLGLRGWCHGFPQQIQDDGRRPH